MRIRIEKAALLGAFVLVLTGTSAHAGQAAALSDSCVEVRDTPIAPSTAGTPALPAHLTDALERSRQEVERLRAEQKAEDDEAAAACQGAFGQFREEARKPACEEAATQTGNRDRQRKRRERLIEEARALKAKRDAEVAARRAEQQAVWDRGLAVAREEAERAAQACDEDGARQAEGRAATWDRLRRKAEETRLRQGAQRQTQEAAQREALRLLLVGLRTGNQKQTLCKDEGIEGCRIVRNKEHSHREPIRQDETRPR